MGLNVRLATETGILMMIGAAVFSIGICDDMLRHVSSPGTSIPTRRKIRMMRPKDIAASGFLLPVKAERELWIMGVDNGKGTNDEAATSFYPYGSYHVICG